MLGILKSRRWGASLAMAGIGAVGFSLGVWHSSPATISAQTPAGPVVPAAAKAETTDYSQRVVAYIHGNVPITREDLGEFLIARHGFAKLDHLVNRKIIEHACAQKGVKVTNEEVEAALDTDLVQLNVDRNTFVKQFLKQYNKSLYEWKEDVIKPRLMLTRLSQIDIKVGDDEIKKLYDANFGERVQCRLIIWTNESGVSPEREALKNYDAIRKSEAEFDRMARSQRIPGLAAVGGRINPIGRGAAEEGKTDVERIAFKLNKDEVSEIFVIPGQGVAVLKCDGRVPPDPTVTFEKQKEVLRKQIYETKLNKAIPEVFKKLKDQAKPLLLLPHGTANPDVMKAAAEEERALKDDKTVVPLPGAPPMPPK